MEWKDQIWEYPRRYKLQQNADSTVDIIPAKGQSIQDGTLVNAENLNSMVNDLAKHEAEKATETELGHVNLSEIVESINNKKGKVQLTKSDIELGNVENYGVATQSETITGTTNEKYITPLRLRQAFNGNIVTGKYTGDASSVRLINLGFEPSAVFVLMGGAHLSDIGTTWSDFNGGLALKGSSAKGFGMDIVRIWSGENGFTVYSKSSDYNRINMNDKDIVYNYIAWR